MEVDERGGGGGGGGAGRGAGGPPPALRGEVVFGWRQQAQTQTQTQTQTTQTQSPAAAAAGARCARRPPATGRRAGEEASIEPFFASAGGVRKRKFEPSDSHVFEVDSLRRNLCSSPALWRKGDQDEAAPRSGNDHRDPLRGGHGLVRSRRDAFKHDEKELAQGLARRRCDELVRESFGTVEKRRRPHPHIYLRTLTGRVVTLEFTGAAHAVRMLHILEQAEEVLGVPREHFRLMYKKEIVSDIQHSSVEIPLGEVLHMVLQVGQ